MATIAETFALAWQYHQAGNFPYAEHLYRQVLQVDATHPDANTKLASILFSQGNCTEAAACFRRVLERRPQDAVACYNLGLALQRLGKADEAVASYRQALVFQPSLFLAWNNLGIVLKSQGKFSEAIECYRKVVELKPDYAEVHANLANALAEQGKLDEALKCYRQALALRPNDPETHYNMGIAFGLVDRFQEATAAFQQALRLQPDHVEAHYQLGILFQEQGKLDDSLAAYDQVLRWDPRHGAAHLNRSLIYLLRGDWARGWPEYEWRWTQPGFKRRPCPQPQWDGSALGGRRILLYAEQGLGDTIQFIRYVPLVKQAGGTVIVECQPAMTRLLAKVPGIDQLVARGSDLPPFDVHAPFLSLPGALRNTPDHVPAQVPYLDADAALVEKWRQEFASLQGLKIGIAWQGNPTNPSDRYRSIALTQFARLANVEGVQLIGLQKGPGAEQVRAVADRFSVYDVSSRLEDFTDTAAVVKNLDLVIACDTAVAHLAGALAVPVWVALYTVPDWRWLLHRTDSPWYPTMRLFRQMHSGDWDEVFERMAGEIKMAKKSGAKKW